MLRGIATPLNEHTRSIADRLYRCAMTASVPASSCRYGSDLSDPCVYQEGGKNAYSLPIFLPLNRTSRSSRRPLLCTLSVAIVHRLYWYLGLLQQSLELGPADPVMR